MSRASAYLAAVASSAVPGLDPVAVRAARGRPGNRFEVGFVTDTQRRAWVVRVPTTEALGAQLDGSADLLPLLAKRVPYAVPSPRGFARVKDGRAVVYPYLHGRSVVLEEVTPGPGVAAEIGRGIAALHNVDRAVYDEAGLPVYDAEACRTRHLADLDRGASTGHVPAALLGRWERVLEDVSVWKFAPTPIHGDLTGDRLLVLFGEEEDAATASVRAVTGWEQAVVGDPALDLAALAAQCSPEAFESIVEAYSVARIERPDRQLRLRARVASELRLLDRLLDAVTAEEPTLVTRWASELLELDEQVKTRPPLLPQPPAPEVRTPVRAVTPVTPVTQTPATDRPGTPTVRITAPATDQADQHGSDEPDHHEPDRSETDHHEADHHEADHAEPGHAEPGHPEADAGDDTQPLRTGARADATTVIPDHELVKARSGGPGSQDDDSWYHELEPQDETGDDSEAAPAAPSPTREPADRAEPENTENTEKTQKTD